MDTNNVQYLKALQSLKEDDLSRIILVPLFEAMGCYRVEFHGGPYEYGKDIIAYYKTPIDEYLYVIQTKKIGEGSDNSDKSIMPTLALQLQQCFLKELPSVSGKSRRPDKVFLATPYKITTRFMEQITELVNQPDKEINLLDGPLIIEKLKEHAPSLFDEIMDVDEKILIQNTQQLNNLELMNALNVQYSVGEIQCYNDLAFFMGNVDSNLLLKGSFKINKSLISISKDAWDHLKKNYFLSLGELFNARFLSASLQEIENEFLIKLNAHQSEENKIKLNKINKSDIEISSLEISLDSIKSDLSIYIKSKKKSDSDDAIEDDIEESPIDKAFKVWWPIIGKNNKKEDFLNTQNGFRNQLVEAAGLKGVNKTYVTLFNNYLSTLDLLVEEYNNNLCLKEDYIQFPQVTFFLDAEFIESWVFKGSHSYLSTLGEINKKGHIEKEYLRAFLLKTQETLSVLEILKELSQELSAFIRYEKTDSNLRDGISVSPFTLFDTHYDIAVYGGAGAGKTTTLQMYAKKLIDDKYNDVIYLPLNRLINKNSIYKYIKKEEGEYDSYKQVLSLMLLSKGLDDTLDNMKKLDLSLRKNTKLKLIIDGLDEVYNKTPHIVISINKFKERYKNIQLILSSRDCVSYISKIKFLGVTLLPFTSIQLKGFIESWFKNSQDEADNLIKNIDENGLYEIVKTPLLATLLCILKKNGIATPSTEMEIFSRRIKLLCGEYDNYKTIKRTSLDSSMLEKAAIKIAFQMHSKNKRTETKENMCKYLRLDSSFPYDANTCKLVVDELINPSNIIHYDSLTETYSFGHLRFQEHLAALELKENRGRDILQLLSKDWWRGTLCLYAQACDFSGMIEEYYKTYDEVLSAITTFKEMVKHRPSNERKMLNDLINGYERTGEIDGFYNEKWDDYDEWKAVKPIGF